MFDAERAEGGFAAVAAVDAVEAIACHAAVTAGEDAAAAAAGQQVGRLDDGDVLAGEALGPGADFSAGGFPDVVVAVFDAGDGVGDLMKDGFADLGLAVEPREVPRELDGACFDDLSGAGMADATDLGGAELALGVAPCEAPALPGDAVLTHEIEGELLGFGQVHAGQ